MFQNVCHNGISKHITNLEHADLTVIILLLYVFGLKTLFVYLSLPLSIFLGLHLTCYQALLKGCFESSTNGCKIHPRHSVASILRTQTKISIVLTYKRIMCTLIYNNMENNTLKYI